MVLYECNQYGELICAINKLLCAIKGIDQPIGLPKFGVVQREYCSFPLKEQEYRGESAVSFSIKKLADK